jgi:exodeoxyribonuclease VII large subunit
VRSVAIKVAQWIDRLGSIWVEGQITQINLRPGTRTAFLVLRDPSADMSLSVTCDPDLIRTSPVPLQEGSRVVVYGKLSFFTGRGTVSLRVIEIRPVGIGELLARIERLKALLAAEGLFDPRLKRPIPFLPKTIGLITGRAGAAERDVLTVARNRWPAVRFEIRNTAVQGPTAVPQILEALAELDRDPAVDVIVLARGGGSLEDLAPFNSELLARAIAKSELPVVSAVGHETDFTIADFVADLRAPTPSAAAELLTEAQHKVEERLEQLHRRLNHACRYLLMRAQERFARLSAPAAFARMRNALARRQQRIDELQYQLDAAWHRQSRQMTERLQKLEARLLRQDVSHRLHVVRERLEMLDGRIVRAEQELLSRWKARHARAEGLLQAVSPLAVLNRGYALVFDEAGVLIRDAAAAAEGGLITTRFAQSTLTSRVLERKLPPTNS